MSYNRERTEEFWRNTYKRWDAEFAARSTERTIATERLDLVTPIYRPSGALRGQIGPEDREIEENRLLEDSRRRRNLIERQLKSDRRILPHHRKNWLAVFLQIDFSRRTAVDQIESMVAQVRTLTKSPTPSIATLLLNDSWHGPSFVPRLSAELGASRVALEELGETLDSLAQNERQYWSV